jgi:alkaline phosphatase
MYQFHKRQFDLSVRLIVVASLIFLALAASVSVAGAAPTGAPTKPLAKNIIVMIADGSGYNQNIAADLYQYGQVGLQPWEQFPFQFAMSTYSSDGWGYDPALAWSDFNYVKVKYTDSAAAATAMACGVKTYDAAIGVDDTRKPVENVIEKAEKQGMSTGVVTSVEFSHATPAGFVAHNVTRNDYAGIAQEMILRSAVDVIMGAGNPFYDKDGLPVTPVPTSYRYVGGQSTWDALVAGAAGGDADGDGNADPWTLIQDRSEFQSLMSGPHPTRVIGVPRVWETLQQARSGDAFAAPYAVPFIQSVPTLAEMTDAALNVLDDDPDGFFLMVEGGAVDWAAHSNQSGRTIEERIEFNHTIEAVLSWVEMNSNWGETLLVITGDHETGYLWGPGSNPTWEPLANNGAGNQPGMAWFTLNHTNSLVPLWAKGDAGRFLRDHADQMDPVRGFYLDNTELAEVLFRALQPVKP